MAYLEAPCCGGGGGGEEEACGELDDADDRPSDAWPAPADPAAGMAGY